MVVVVVGVGLGGRLSGRAVEWLWLWLVIKDGMGWDWMVVVVVVVGDQRWDGIGWLLDRGGVVVAWVVWSVLLWSK